MAKFCGKCGTALDSATGLCPNCSSNENTSHQEFVEKAPKKKRSKSSKTVITVVLSICLFLTLTLSLAIFSVRNALREDNVEKILENVDIVSLINTSDSVSEDLENFYTYMQDTYNIEITDKQFERFIEKTGIKSFIAEKVAEFAEDFFEGKARLEFNNDEIAEIIQKNSDRVYKEFGFTGNTYSFAVDIAEWLLGEEDKIVIFSTNDLKYDYPALYSLSKIITSSATMVILIILSLLIILALIISCYSQAFTAVGIDFTILGGVITVISVLSAWITPLWKIICGDSPIGSIIGNAISTNALVGVIFLVLGILALVFKKKIVSVISQIKSAKKS